MQLFHPTMLSSAGLIGTLPVQRQIFFQASVWGADARQGCHQWALGFFEEVSTWLRPSVTLYSNKRAQI